MTHVRVIYHQDAGAWWADSPDLDGYVAVAESLDDLRVLVREGVAFHLETDAPVEILESTDRGSTVGTWRIKEFPEAFASAGTANPTRGQVRAHSPMVIIPA